MKLAGQKRFEAVVKGRVQGVCFRYFTQKEAGELGITGEVKNMPDGSVFVLAEGEEETLKQLLNILHQGPDLAHVSEVIVDWQNFTGHYSNFSVVY